MATNIGLLQDALRPQGKGVPVVSYPLKKLRQNHSILRHPVGALINKEYINRKNKRYGICIVFLFYN